MALSEASDAPAFQSLGEETEYSPGPVSKVAVFAFVAGLISLLTPLSGLWTPFCIAAIVLGLVAAARIALVPDLQGGRFACFGLLLGALTLSWSVVAKREQDAYLYSLSAEYAKAFLQEVADGNIPLALELMQTEGDRQLTGTDLEAYYRKPDPEDPEGRDRIEEFLVNPAAGIVLENTGEWEFARGLSWSYGDSKTVIFIEMENTERKPPNRLRMEMWRYEDRYNPANAGYAYWQVRDFKIAEEGSGLGGSGLPN